MPFGGAKLILFIGPRIVVITRDDIPTIPWPGYLDFPGGARDGEESAEDCVLRETFEELGLRLHSDDLVWRHLRRKNVYFAAHLPDGTDRDITFGNEGQGWKLMEPEVLMPPPCVGLRWEV